MNTIIVDHGVRNKLMKLFNTSYPTVRKALDGKSKSLLSLRIRKAALENGGGRDCDYRKRQKAGDTMKEKYEKLRLQMHELITNANEVLQELECANPDRIKVLTLVAEDMEALIIDAGNALLGSCVPDIHRNPGM